LLIAALSSLGLPGLNSFAGEFLALLGVFRVNIVLGVLGTAVVIPAAWYMLRFFLGIMEGAQPKAGAVAASVRKGALNDLTFGEFWTLVPLLVLIFYIGVQPLPLTSILEPAIFQALGNVLIK
ncbi:MAG TPA: hypothetical protein VFB12_00760, partial [Ktedonobacteraceae bacterium]|nr:hypothetical protein [Ktedonobacteraceae bacterium]